jgi:hypothetical protein
MVEYTCDRCKKKIGIGEKVFTISIPFFKKTYDLCSEDFKASKAFIEHQEEKR